MAIKRTSSNSISNAVKLSTGFASAAIPNSPTIGAATATSDVTATVAYTAAVLGATGSTFTATSNPGSVTGTGSSPITVTGLTASTSYTFSVTAGNANGTSAASSASNSITTSAPSGSYESIATVTVSSATPTISFTSIPATYTHLQIRSMCFGVNDDENLYIRFNSDSGSNYARHYLEGNGATASASATAPDTGGVFSNTSNGTSPYIAVCDILDYAKTNKNTTIRALSGRDRNGSGSIALRSSVWLNTAAVTSITILAGLGNLSSGSQFALYGIKGA